MGLCSDEMDSLSCFYQILKDVACLGNRATEHSKGKNGGSENANATSCPAASHTTDYTKWFVYTWATRTTADSLVLLHLCVTITHSYC